MTYQQVGRLNPHSVFLDLRSTVLPPNQRPGAVQPPLLLHQLLRQTDGE